MVKRKRQPPRQCAIPLSYVPVQASTSSSSSSLSEINSDDLLVNARVDLSSESDFETFPLVGKKRVLPLAETQQYLDEEEPAGCSHSVSNSARDLPNLSRSEDNDTIWRGGILYGPIRVHDFDGNVNELVDPSLRISQSEMEEARTSIGIVTKYCEVLKVLGDGSGVLHDPKVMLMIFLNFVKSNSNF